MAFTMLWFITNLFFIRASLVHKSHRQPYKSQVSLCSMTSVKKTAGPAELFQSGSASQNKVKEDRGVNIHIMKS